MSINTKRVVGAGLVAGVVAMLLDTLLNGFLLGAVWEEAMTALNPALPEGMQSPVAIGSLVVLDLLWGIAVVLVYAAIRPRFGPGPGTAVKAALLAWFASGIAWGFNAALGIYSWTLLALGLLCWFLVTMGAALVGARLYKEDPV